MGWETAGELIACALGALAGALLANVRTRERPRPEEERKAVRAAVPPAEPLSEQAYADWCYETYDGSPQAAYEEYLRREGRRRV